MSQLVRWDRATENALEASYGLVIILSPKSVASENVMDEVAYFLEERKQIFPVLYQNCKIPFRIRRLQYSDFTSNYDIGLKQLLYTLRGEEPPETSGQTEIESPFVPKVQEPAYEKHELKDKITGQAEIAEHLEDNNQPSDKIDPKNHAKLKTKGGFKEKASLTSKTLVEESTKIQHGLTIAINPFLKSAMGMLWSLTTSVLLFLILLQNTAGVTLHSIKEFRWEITGLPISLIILGFILVGWVLCALVWIIRNNNVLREKNPRIQHWPVVLATVGGGWLVLVLVSNTHAIIVGLALWQIEIPMFVLLIISIGLGWVVWHFYLKLSFTTR